MIVDPASAARSQLALERGAVAAASRDKYLKERLRQIKVWNTVGWLFWLLLAVGTLWIYKLKPIYLDFNALAKQIEIGKLPSNEMAQLAALGSLLFWGMIVLMAGFIFQIYAAMYSERKLIRLFDGLHQDDLAKHLPPDAGADRDEEAPLRSDHDQSS
jgi:hypothetical protein